MLVDFPKIDMEAFGGTSIWYAIYALVLLLPYGPALPPVSLQTDTQAVLVVSTLATTIEFILYKLLTN